MKRLLPILSLVALLGLSGCEDQRSQDQRTMDERLPNTQSILIVTDEVGRHYLIQRHHDQSWLYDVTPYNPPKPPVARPSAP